MFSEHLLDTAFLSAGDIGGSVSLREHEQRLQEIRPVEPKDYPVLFAWLIDSTVAPHLKDIPKSEDEVAEFYSDPTRDSYIALDMSGNLIGVFSLLKPQSEENVCTLERFVIRPDLQKKGYGQEMLQHALSEAFQHKKYDGMQLRVGMGVEGDEGTVNFYIDAGFGLVTFSYENPKQFGSFSTREEAEEKANEHKGQISRIIVSPEGDDRFYVIAPKALMFLSNPEKGVN